MVEGIYLKELFGGIVLCPLSIKGNDKQDNSETGTKSYEINNLPLHHFRLKEVKTTAYVSSETEVSRINPGIL